MKTNKKRPAPRYRKISTGGDITIYQKTETLPNGNEKRTEVTIDDVTGNISSTTAEAKFLASAQNIAWTYEQSSAKEFNLAFKSWLGLI